MKIADHEYCISSDVAKLLKEAGFDWKVNHYYFTQNGKIEVKSDFKHPGRNYNAPMATMDSKSFEFEVCSCPTLDVAQRWLREVKKMCIVVFPVENRFTFIIVELGEKLNLDDYILEYYTYEEAQEAGIKNALEIILNK